MLNGPLLKKMAVRREIFPAASVALSFVDFAVASIIVVGLAMWYGLTIGWSILLLPFFILLLALCALGVGMRSEEHTSELQSLMRISYAVFCLKKKKKQTYHTLNKN